MHRERLLSGVSLLLLSAIALGLLPCSPWTARAVAQELPAEAVTAEAREFPAETVTAEAPESVTESGNDNTLDFLSGMAWRLMSDIAVELLSGNRTELLSGNQPHLLSENEAELLSGNQAKLMSENQAAVLSENDTDLVSENEITFMSNNQITIHITESGNNNEAEAESETTPVRLRDGRPDGQLTRKELAREKANKRSQKAKRRFQRLDRDGDGFLSADEFCGRAAPGKKPQLAADRAKSKQE